jgi:hypothetical protein
VETHLPSTEQDQADLCRSAGRELGAFLTAVAELFGPDEVEHTAEDWLDELESQETLPASMHWRSITIAAAARLAHRMSAGVAVNTKVSPIPSSNCSGTTPQA